LLQVDIFNVFESILLLPFEQFPFPFSACHFLQSPIFKFLLLDLDLGFFFFKFLYLFL